MNLLRALVYCAVFISSLVGHTASAFAAPPMISWEVENRFKYFKRTPDFRELVKVYEEIKQTSPQPTVLQLEKSLQEKVLAKKFNGIENATDIRRGWAASIYEHTCGKQGDHSHGSCKMQNGDFYLEPKSTNILL